MRRAVVGSLVALGLTFYLMSSVNARLSWQLEVLAVTSLLLELLAVRQKRLGLFSAAFSCNLAAALQPGVGPGLAGYLVLLGVALRTPLKGAMRGRQPDWPARWREALGDLLSQLAPLAFLNYYQRVDAAACLGSLSLYLPLAFFLPAWLAQELPDFDLREWREIRWLTGFLYFSLGFLGVAMSRLLDQGGLWLLPVLFILQRSARTEALRMQVMDSERAQLREQMARRELAISQAREEHLSIWLERLVFLLDGARALSATLDSATLVERFGQLLLPLSPRGAVLLGNQVVVSWPAGPVLGAAGNLVLPLGDEGGQLGCVILTAAGVEVERVVQLLCFHLASAMRGAQYLEQLRQTQAQLVQSSKMAAMGQFAAGVAHEINSPLAAITVALETAELKLQDPEATRKRLGLARKAVDKATAIIGKLLYYSREGSQGKALRSLHQIIKDTLEIFGPQLEKEGVQVRYDAGVDVEVEVNENEIQQVLVNLLLNARDATSGLAERQVVVRTFEDAVVQVEDNGPGVPSDIRERIFDPFFTTKDVGSGTGLGLSVSYQIAQNHGGTLELLEGSCFQLRLPKP